MDSIFRAVLFLFLLAGSAFAAAPTISVPTATPGSNGAATIDVNVTANGATTTVTFNYGLTTSYGSTISVTVAAGAVNQATTATLAGLIGGKTYHFQVNATNSDGTATPSVDDTFVEPAYAPTLTLLPPTHTGGVESLHAKVTANGTPGNVFFQYGATTAYGTNSGTVAIVATDVDKLVDFILPAPLTYHYRFVYDDGVAPSPDVVTSDDTSNKPPQAVNDVVKLTSTGAVTISVLTNDTDPDGDTLTISTVAAPKNGTETHTTSEVTYTPGAGFSGSDSFTYVIDDGFGGISTATITVRALTSALTGTHGGLVKKSNGREVGYFTLTTTVRGNFSGIFVIDGQRYALTGTLAADGTFTGFAAGDGGVVPVSLSTKSTDTGAVITASIALGTWTADLSVSDTDATDRPKLFGRYTAGLGAGGAGPTNGNDPGTPPDGSGWLAIRVSEDATASIKGRLPDGRSFSTRGTVNIVNGVATLSFFDDPEASRVIGLLTLGDTVGGTVRTERNSSGDGRFPRGFDTTQTADGARYVQPVPGKRVLDTTTSKGQDLTISFSGGDLVGTISRDLYLDDRDKVKVLNSGAEELKLSIDRKSGRFQAKITVDTEGTRIKGTGVLIQNPTGGPGGRGLGTFNTQTNTGTVTISAAGSSGGTSSSLGGTTPAVVP